jgi:hypothetical protein
MGCMGQIMKGVWCISLLLFKIHVSMLEPAWRFLENKVTVNETMSCVCRTLAHWIEKPLSQSQAQLHTISILVQ